MLKKTLLILLLTVSSSAWAEMIIQSIQLQHRPAAEIIPIVKPMLAPRASITGTGYTLILKSTPENISQIQTMLEDIDVNQKLLKISVSLEKQSEAQQSRQSANLSAGSDHTRVQIGRESATQEGAGNISLSNGRNKFNANLYESRSRSNSPVIQQMSVTEGYWAKISMGQSIPVTSRTRNADGTVTETTEYRNVATGYEVMPRTHGDQVTLEIRPLRQSAGTDGSINSTGLESTVSGKLGEWIFLGGTDHTENLRNSAITTRTRIRSSELNQIWVKVERP